MLAPMMTVCKLHPLPHTIDRYTQVYKTDMQCVNTCVPFNCLIFIVYLGHALDDTTGESSGESQRMNDDGGIEDERTNGNHTVTYKHNTHVHTHTLVHMHTRTHHTHTILTRTHSHHTHAYVRHTHILTVIHTYKMCHRYALYRLSYVIN